MSPALAGLLGAAIGAIAGMAGGFIVQAMQSTAARRSRIALLGAQLAAASYLVTQSARRSRIETGDPLPPTFYLDVPAFQEGLLASQELAIIAPDEVAKKAISLANAMVRASREASRKEVTDKDWRVTLTNLRDDRNAFTQSMRDSKLRLVARAGASAAATGAISQILR